MATIDFVVSGNRIATESFTIGKIYEIIFTDSSFLICACNHVGNNFVVFQRELPELLFTLNMETASSVRSIEETGGGGGTYNYNSLENKPQINSVELTGNKSSSDLGLQSALDTSQLDAVNSGITAAKVTAFEGKQDAITSDNKLSADLVDDAATTNKFVTAADKTAWNDKQNALTASQLDAVNSGITAAKVTSFEAKQDAITSDNKLSADLVDDAATTNKFVTAADKTAWNDKQNAIDSLHMLDADLVDDTTATHKFATAAQLSQIATNENNISTDEAALVELVDSGAKSLIPYSLESLKAINTNGTWVSNVFTANNGVSYTLNSDMTITVNGTATSSAWFTLNANASLGAGTFDLLSGITDRGTDVITAISPTFSYNDIIMNSSNYNYYDEQTFSPSQTGLIYAIRVQNGKSFSDVLVKPMLCTKAAWDISQSYQPYRPSYQELYEMVKALQPTQ